METTLPDLKMPEMDGTGIDWLLLIQPPI